MNQTHRVKIVLLVLCVVLDAVVGLALPAEAQVVITGTTVQGTWTEPTQNATGTPLMDLASTTLFYEIPGGMEMLCAEAPATSPQGGQQVTGSCTVPVGNDMEADVHFRVRAADTSGNESAPSPDVVRRVDHLAPAAPLLE